MTSSFRIWLVMAALAAGLLVAACGGDDDKGDDGDGNGAAATVPADDEGDGATATDDGGGEDGGGDATAEPDGEGDGGVSSGGDAFEGVPVPEGADEQSSGTLSGSEIPFLDPSGEMDPEAYGTIELKVYSVDSSPADVLDFYRDELSDWEEVFVFGGGTGDEEGGFGIWTRDDGAQAMWVATSASAGGTDLTLMVGTQE